MTIPMKKSSTNNPQKITHETQFAPHYYVTEVQIGPFFCCHVMEKAGGSLAAFQTLISVHSGREDALSALGPDTTYMPVHFLGSISEGTPASVGSGWMFNCRNSRIFTLNPTIRRKTLSIPHCSWGS